jgi:hypothetical protein
MKLKIVSDGAFTKVYDLDNGEEIEHITEVDFYHTVGGPPNVRIKACPNKTELIITNENNALISIASLAASYIKRRDKDTLDTLVYLLEELGYTFN